MRLLLLCCLISSLSYGQAIRAISYNIRYDNPGDGENRWELRREFLVNQMKFYRPDVLGIQEGLEHQVNYIKEHLGYEYAGVGRDDGETKGEYSAIFYNPARLQVEKSGTFWLSETPGEPSVGWDASMERICTHVLLRDKQSDRLFFVFNTHFDHIGTEARANSARLIVRQMDALNTDNHPQILMGDLNLEPYEEAIQYLSGVLQDAGTADDAIVFGPEGTFNGFRFDQAVVRRIDYIFADKQLIDISQYAVLSDSRDLKYPSDHLPVFVELILK